MNIIAGKYKNRKLLTAKGKAVRPSTGVLKEGLFNMLTEEILQSSFLDLFAGTGGVGLEALSRGAENVCFVEKDKRNIRLINDNIKIVGAEESCKVLCSSVEQFLNSSRESFDLIFMDPPYEIAEPDYIKGLFNLIKTNNLLKENGYIILEESAKTPATAFQTPYLMLCKDKKYSISRLSLWQLT